MSEPAKLPELGSPVLRKGERVVVMNPTPKARGTVLADVSTTARYAHVEWDDSERGWSQARLLKLEEEVDG
jgi:hypothetical protein